MKISVERHKHSTTTLLPLSNAVANEEQSPGSFSISGKNLMLPCLKSGFFSVAFQSAPVAVRMLSLLLSITPPFPSQPESMHPVEVTFKTKENEIVTYQKCCGAPMQSSRAVNPPLVRSSSATGE